MKIGINIELIFFKIENGFNNRKKEQAKRKKSVINN